MHRKTYRMAAAIALSLALAFASAACSDFDGWDYSRFPGAVTGADGATGGEACDVSAASCDCGGGVAADGDTQGVSRTCNGCLESMVGRAMRFRELVVTEPIVPTAPNPQGLPDFLNGIWQEDVRRYILNIMLRVDAVDLTTGQLSLVGGAGWHNLTFDQIVGPGEEVTVPPSTFYLIPGSLGAFTVTIDDTCHFTPIGDTQLGFHPGPDDHATICGPEFDYPNAIPILKLTPTGAITDDCTAVVQGHLEGCIPKADADKICSWGPAPDYSGWYFAQNDAITPIDGTAEYCKHWCGTTPGASFSKWTNFGGFVTIIRVPLSCDSDGDGVMDGYGIAGDFTADLVDLMPVPE